MENVSKESKEGAQRELEAGTQNESERDRKSDSVRTHLGQDASDEHDEACVSDCVSAYGPALAEGDVRQGYRDLV